MEKIALYLAGGGARGAYQAGVLKGIHELVNAKRLPFTIISGVSVGSINAAILAQHAQNFKGGVDKLIDLWSNIHCEKIFNTSNYSLCKSILRNISHMFIKQRKSGYLLDTTPLRKFIDTNVNFDAINKNIEENVIETLEVISKCYENIKTTSFYEHSQSTFEDWNYPRHISQRVKLSTNHILASSAIPLFFPTVKIDGMHYGDGSLGLVSPLRGTLRFNAEKILIIGARCPPAGDTAPPTIEGEISFSQVLGTMLNSMFLDNLDRDIENVNRMNDIAREISLWNKRNAPWRPAETLYIRPSVDIAETAQARYRSVPVLLRVLLNSMGARSHSGDLLSFLLFEEQFASQLIEHGYQDAMNSQETILSFFKN